MGDQQIQLSKACLLLEEGILKCNLISYFIKVKKKKKNPKYTGFNFAFLSEYLPALIFLPLPLLSAVLPNNFFFGWFLQVLPSLLCPLTFYFRLFSNQFPFSNRYRNSLLFFCHLLGEGVVNDSYCSL